MILLDAYCLIALVLDEPAAAEVQEFLRSRPVAIPAANLAETVDVLQRVWRIDSSDVRSTLWPLLAGGLEVIPTTSPIAWRGGAIRARCYEPRTREVSLADCILLASAGDGDEVATADPAVAVSANEERVRVVALPDSRGVRPS